MSSDVVLNSSLIIIQHIFCIDCIYYTFFFFFLSGTAQQYFFSYIILLWDHVVDTIIIIALSLELPYLCLP